MNKSIEIASFKSCRAQIKVSKSLLPLMLRKTAMKIFLLPLIFSQNVENSLIVPIKNQLSNKVIGEIIFKVMFSTPQNLPSTISLVNLVRRNPIK